MRDSDATPEQLVTKADALTVPRTTPEQARHASIVVCDRIAADAIGAPYAETAPLTKGARRVLARKSVPVLELLGLVAPVTERAAPHWDAVGVVHGTASAIDWHAAQTDHRGRALCSRCRQYVGAQERAAARRERREIGEGH